MTLAPGRPDIVRIIDEVVSNYLSMYFAAPDRFGERLEAFVTELTDMLSEMYQAWSELVETMGIEPTTPCLQSRCSSQLSYVPGTGPHEWGANTIAVGSSRTTLRYQPDPS